jgi:hypothetical protein
MGEHSLQTTNKIMLKFNPNKIIYSQESNINPRKLMVAISLVLLLSGCIKPKVGSGTGPLEDHNGGNWASGPNPDVVPKLFPKKGDDLSKIVVQIMPKCTNQIAESCGLENATIKIKPYGSSFEEPVIFGNEKLPEALRLFDKNNSIGFSCPPEVKYCSGSMFVSEYPENGNIYIILNDRIYELKKNSQQIQYLGNRKSDFGSAKDMLIEKCLIKVNDKCAWNDRLRSNF